MGFSGGRLREYRKMAGLTQEQLASRLGVRRIQVSLYENGHRNPSLARLQVLSNVLGVRVDELLDERGVVRGD